MHLLRYNHVTCVVSFQLDDMCMGDLLQQYQMMLIESIGYYGNAIKEMEYMHGR